MTAKKRVVICWSDISGYMAACWRALVARGQWDVHVVAWKRSHDTEFAAGVMDGIPCTLLTDEQREDRAHVRSIVTGMQPDVVVLPGWMSRAYMALAREPALAGARFVMTSDNPWWGRVRQYAARYGLRAYLRRMDRIFVPGERAWQYALRLGFGPDRIRRGLYGVDVEGLAPLLEQRRAGPWPRSFLYVGRYAEIKGLDVLVQAYRAYRAQVDAPWALQCCGKGPLESLLADEPGINNHGFVQPGDLGPVWQRVGAFVLASRYDAWPLVVVEACAAGLPVLATENCGSTVELVRPAYNGWLFPREDVGALTRALVAAHRAYDQLPEMGARAQEFARAYSAQAWALRWEGYLDELVAGERAGHAPAPAVARA